MAKDLIDDELWAVIEPLLLRRPPKRRRFRCPGRKPLEPRKALTGIVFVFRTGIPWNELPREMGCGSGRGGGCWRRLQAWQKAGVWDKLHRVLLSELREANKIDGWDQLRQVTGPTKEVEAAA